jgi:hypothetical protein
MSSTGLFILFLTGLVIFTCGMFWVIMSGIDKLEAKDLKRIVHDAPRPGDNISREEARRAVRKVIAQRKKT